MPKYTVGKAWSAWDEIPHFRVIAYAKLPFQPVALFPLQTCHCLCTKARSLTRQSWVEHGRPKPALSAMVAQARKGALRLTGFSGSVAWVHLALTWKWCGPSEALPRSSLNSLRLHFSWWSCGSAVPAASVGLPPSKLPLRLFCFVFVFKSSWEERM